MRTAFLYVLSKIYGWGLRWRNIAYNRRWLKSKAAPVPTLVVGNLNVGGTGKSPCVEFLVKKLQAHYRVALLSRGYGRSTKGFVLSDAHSTADLIGDEPFQLKEKFPQVPLAVCENRIRGIQQLLQLHPDIELVILDDAFQHRTLRGDCNVLLTPYEQRYPHDHLLPLGSLRDEKQSRRRADMILVTRCPASLDKTAMAAITCELEPLAQQPIFFAALRYGIPYFLNPQQNTTIPPAANQLPTPLQSSVALLLAAIARPQPLIDYLQQHYTQVTTLLHRDHHFFTENDLKNCQQTYQYLCAKYENVTVLTTEKDAARLRLHLPLLQELQMPVVVVPIELYVLKDETLFLDTIKEKIAAARLRLQTAASLA
ncbi:MAG: tetraacyldisaccharide 4'-kinase [Sphingobacteriales bacterium]|nr:tetraacyldisaccharide 4'-kinase [Sphingobacteriales bacterium]